MPRSGLTREAASARSGPWWKPRAAGPWGAESLRPHRVDSTRDQRGQA